MSRRFGLILLLSVAAACGGREATDLEGASPRDSIGSGAPETTSTNGAEAAVGLTDLSAMRAMGLGAGDRKALHSSAVPTTEVEIAWRDADLSGAVRKQSESVHVRLQNNSDSKQRVELSLVAAGLDGRLIRRELSTIQIAAGATRDVPVSVGRLPMQSETTATFTAVEAEFSRSDGSFVTTTTAPLYSYFRNGYRDAVFYDERDVATKPEPKLLARTSRAVEGRILEEDDTWHDVSLAGSASLVAPTGGARQGATRLNFIPANDLAARHPLPRAAAREGTSNIIRPVIRLCSNWFVIYADRSSISSEDYLATRGWHYEPAKFASIQVTDANWTQNFWEGNLDETGCADIPSLPLGDYQVVQYSDGQQALGRSFSTLETLADGTPIVVQLLTDFSITGSTGGAVTVYPGVNGDAINVASIVGQILFAQTQLGGLGMPVGPYTVRANIGCTDYAPFTDACFHPSNVSHALDEVWTGTTVINSKRGAYWRGMMAHEIGHMVQWKAMGLPTADLTDNSANPQTQSLCRCDHYTTAWANREHCLQSREFQGGAESEGFAQAFATRVLNRNNEFDAVMPYYKPVKFSAATNTVNPPMNISAFLANSGPRMRNFCPAAGKGIEWDWMVFFYRISTESSANFTTFDDLFKIYLRACNTPAGCFSGIDINWTQLVTAAQAHFGGSATNPKFVRFRDMGNTTGVNY